ncbi:MAG: alkaline phosphatase family protein [Humibacter sp.]
MEQEHITMSNQESEQQSNSRVTRRHLLQAAGIGAVGAVAAASGVIAAQAANAATPATSTTTHRTGTIKDLKHIVIVMQENRSFDHYFGTLDLAGVRGFSDKQVLTWQNGQSIYHDPSSRAEGYTLPYRADATKYNAQNAANRMWYYEAADIPWHQAIAKAYTVADHYFCALNTSTDPNRIVFWSGTNDPQGKLGGGPRINNNDRNSYSFQWKTYPEVLQDAGISWNMYLNNNPDIGGGWFENSGDNMLHGFAAFNPANASAQDKQPGGLLYRGGVLGPDAPVPANVGNDVTSLDWDLKDFIADCAAGTLPQVSWVTSPFAWMEHPNSAPNHGAMYCDRIIQAVHENPDLWDSTLIIINFDEPNGANRVGQGGFFDHVVPPIPEVGTDGERAPGLLPGFGGRIPLTMISPWTRGGWVCSEVFDHTSTIKLIEEWTKSLGKPAICENISDWRRSISGDMLAAIDFSSFDNSFPSLPSRDLLHAAVVADTTFPAVPEPAVGAQKLPTQSFTGVPKVRPLSFQPHGVLVEDRAAGTVTARFTLDGGPSGKAISLIGLADQYLSSLVGAENVGIGQNALPLTVRNDGAKTYTWDTTTTDGNYAFSFYGPDRFIRSFAGALAPAGSTVDSIPSVDAELVSHGSNRFVQLTLSNAGLKQVRFTVTPNDFAGLAQSVFVGQAKSTVIKWPADANGYYDVIVTTPDLSRGITHRYAGRIS